jgi:hypothetical protein
MRPESLKKSEGFSPDGVIVRKGHRMSSSPTPDFPSQLLSAWRVAPRRNPGFRAAVWARLEAGADALPWWRYARQHALVVGGAMALAVVLGGVTGHGWARARVESDRAQLAAAYVGSLDARAMTGR